MRFEPRGNRVVVEPLEGDSVTRGGIHLPDTAKKKERQGIVRALGTGDQLGGLGVGYRVAYAQYAGTEIRIDDAKDWLVLEASDIIGVWCA